MTSMVVTRAQKRKRECLWRELEAQEKLQDESSCTMDIRERFEILGELGHGAYGSVFRARDRERNGEVVAVKKVYVREDLETGIPHFVMREVANLKRLSAATSDSEKDPHIVRLLDVQSVDGRYAQEMVFYLVFEHMERDLDSFIRTCPPPGMGIEVIKDFIGQILTGVDWMHVNNIIHRDLKPQNILVSRDGRNIKIADFGLSRVIKSNVVLSTQVVTQWYRAPEVLLHFSYDKAVDIWSVGCIFAEMLRNRPLFMARKNGEKAQLEEIFRIIGTPTTEEWPTESSIAPDQFARHGPTPWTKLLPEACDKTYDLISKMLVFQPHKRLTAEDASHHNYFHDEVSSEDGYRSPKSTGSSRSSPSFSQSSASSILNSSLDSGIQDS